MIEWGLKSKPKKFLGLQTEHPKNPMPYFRAINISRGTTRPEYAGTIINLKVVLNTHKNPNLNQALQKNSCQKFSYPKNPEIKYFKPEKSFDYPFHLKSGVPP